MDNTTQYFLHDTVAVASGNDDGEFEMEKLTTG